MLCFTRFLHCSTFASSMVVLFIDAYYLQCTVPDDAAQRWGEWNSVPLPFGCRETVGHRTQLGRIFQPYRATASILNVFEVRAENNPASTKAPWHKTHNVILIMLPSHQHSLESSALEMRKRSAVQNKRVIWSGSKDQKHIHPHQLNGSSLCRVRYFSRGIGFLLDGTGGPFFIFTTYQVGFFKFE